MDGAKRQHRASASEPGDDSAESAPYLLGFVANLVFTEPHSGQAGGDVRLVTASVRRLLSRCSVVAPAIRLNYQPELRPVEIDPVAVYVSLCFGARQPCGSHDREELTLEAGVGEGVKAEESAHAGHSWPRSKLCDGATERFGIDEAETIRLADCPLHPPLRHAGGEVDQGGNRIRRGYPRHLTPVLRTKITPPVHPDTGASAEHTRDDFDRANTGNRRDTPERRGTAVAEQCSGSAGKRGGHPAPLLAQFRSPDCVDTAPQWVQATLCDAMFDRARADPALEQLRPCNHPVLLADQVPNSSRRILLLFPHSRGDKASIEPSSPPSAGVAAGFGRYLGSGRRAR